MLWGVGMGTRGKGKLYKKKGKKKKEMKRIGDDM